MLNELSAVLPQPFADYIEELLRIVAAALAGMVLGIEREWRSKPAGLRTNMLVSVAAATYTVLALDLARRTGGQHIEPDPLRIFEAVTAGAAFLGAGCIIQARGNVIGVTTGATVWLAAAVGLACGAGYFVVALFTTAFGFVILRFVGYAIGDRPEDAD